MRRLAWAGLLLVAGCSFTPEMEEPSDVTPEVRFAFPNSITDETVGNATVFVELSIPAPAPVTVGIAAVGGTAAAGEDYRLEIDELRFEVGQRSFEVPIAIVGDTLAEQDEALVLELRDPTNATLGQTKTHDLNISANILPRISFAMGTQSVDENILTQRFPVALDGASVNDVLFAYSVTGSATFGADHSLAPDMMTLPAGMTTIDITAPILDDKLDEDDETIDLALTALSGAVVGQIKTRQHTIHDEDPAPIVGFASATGTTDETGTVTLTVRLDAMSAKTAKVDYAVTPGSATSADFTATSGTLTFPPGTTEQSFSVTITEDAVDEPNETFTLTLSNLVNASTGGIVSHELTITDDDPPTISFEAAASTYDEDDGDRTVRIVLSSPHTQAITFDISTGGSATKNADYNIPNGPFTIPAGQMSFDLAVDVIQNAPQTEPNETAEFTLSDVDNATVGGTPKHTMTLTE